jgi:hypothetical protein
MVQQAASLVRPAKRLDGDSPNQDIVSLGRDRYAALRAAGQWLGMKGELPEGRGVWNGICCTGNGRSPSRCKGIVKTRTR